MDRSNFRIMHKIYFLKVITIWHYAIKNQTCPALAAAPPPRHVCGESNPKVILNSYSPIIHFNS